MKTIGIIGGGQLGLMLAEEIHHLGARCLILDPDPQAPARSHCDEQIVAAYDDPVAVETLCRRSDAVTYEFENVPSEILIPLIEKYNIPQGYKPLYDSQDRLREKCNAQEHGLQTPKFAAVDSMDDLLQAVERVGFPSVLKTRTMGYDGHGQLILRSEADLAKAEALLSVPCILEEFVAFDFEVSVVSVASKTEVVSFPIGRNVHREGILDLCVVPAQLSETLNERLIRQSQAFMRRCGYEGILAIEYFVKGEEIYFNEMAPRPHNSGHYTIEGATTNQYRELARYLLGEALEEPKLLVPTIMKNILGEDFEAARQIQSQAAPNVFVHLYGKSECRPKRKMGHITFTHLSEEDYMKHWAARFV